MTNYEEPEMSDTPTPAPAQTSPPVSLSTVLLLTLALSIAVANLLGVAEVAAALRLIPPEKNTQALAATYYIAAAGRAVATHAVVWTPLLLIVGLVYYFVAGRRPNASPECFLPTALFFLVGMIFLPAGLEVAKRLSFEFVFPILVGVPILTVCVYFLLRLMRRACGVRGLRRLWHSLGVISAVAAVALLVAFVRSPLLFPNEIRFTDGAAGPAVAANSKPNVLFIVLDTVRTDRMSLFGFGESTTPFLNEWSKNALVFENCTSAGIWTLPTHAAMFTRFSLRETGIGSKVANLDDKFETLAEKLSASGYATGLFSCNPLVTMPSANLMQGFQKRILTRDFYRRTRLSFDSVVESNGITPLLPWQDVDYGAGLTNLLVDEYLGENPQQPKFVFINFMECHAPFLAPKRYRQMFMTPQQVERSYDLAVSAYGEMVEWLNMRGILYGYDFFAAEDREVIKRQYLASMRYLDDRVRETLAIFKKHGILDNTLVVIVADHGEYLDTHGVWTHHVFAYQDVIHVPLLIKTPRQIEGGRERLVAHQTDLFPTILNAALGDGACADTRDSRDLLKLIKANNPERIAIAEVAEPRLVEKRVFMASDDPAIRHRGAAQIAATDGRWKFIQSSDGMRELFDLSADPGELNNLIAKESAEGLRLENYIKGWLVSTPEYVPPPESRDGADMTPEQIQTLKSLGYVGGG